MRRDLKIFLISISIISFIFFLFLILNFQKIQCTKLGDLIFDKVIGINSNCYERKLKGVIYPWVTNLEGRYSYIVNKKAFKCPKNAFVIMVSGQSNSSNFLKSNKKYKNKHYNYFDGKCYELSNPVLGAEGEMSSLIPAIASKLDKYKDIIFFTSGIGGLSIKEANHKNQTFIDYNKTSLEELDKNDNHLKVFIWIQGEADAGNSFDYINNFNSIFNKITKNLTGRNNIKLIITQTTRCKNKEDEILRKKQKLISNSKDALLKTINTDKLGNKFRYDECHFNDLGIEKIAYKISNIIKELIKQ